MTIHSSFALVMAKKIDETKIERIRSSAISIIVREGIHNSSVAAIADHAGVSTGYLYRYYKGKEELINDLLGVNFDAINLKVTSLIKDNICLRELVAQVVNLILNIAESDEEKVKFIIMLFNDFSLNVNARLSEQIDILAEELMSIAAEDASVRRDVSKIDFYTAMVGLPMQYLAIHFKGIIGNRKRGAIDRSHIVSRSLNIIFKEI